MGRVSSQFNQAQQFSAAVLAQQSAKSRPSQPSLEPLPPLVYDTGHSLGGTLAAYVASTCSPIGSHYAVTFDNPSHYQQLNANHGGQLSQWTAQQRRDMPITTYLTRPTFINCAGGPHLGRVMRIQVELADTAKTLPTALLSQALPGLLTVLKPQLPMWAVPAGHAAFARLLANIRCHDQALILAAFSDQPGQIYHQLATTHYVSTWPNNLPQWLAFEQSCLRSGQDPLTVLPTAPGADEGYQVLPAQSPRQDYQEVIPLRMFETPLAALIKQWLTHMPLTETQQTLSHYIDPFVWLCLALDDTGEAVLVKGPLTSWELLTYFRQQAHEACHQEKLSLSSLLYPDLHHLQSSVARPPLVTGWGSLFSTAGLSSAPMLPAPNKAVVDKTEDESAIIEHKSGPARK